MKKLLFATVALVVLGAAGTLIYGDMPLKTYYPNGVLRTETQRSFFKKNGTHKEYHPNGQLKLEAMYVDNVQNGQEKQYLDNGTLKRKVTYVNGAKNGTETIYYDKSRVEIPYENGKKEGKRLCHHRPDAEVCRNARNIANLPRVQHYACRTGRERPST